MVFSVQQGEHGPLVVYKLEVPERAAATAAPPVAPASTIPAHAPGGHGTAAMPTAASRPAAPAGVSVLDIIGRLAPAAARREAAPAGPAGWDWNSDAAVTLDEVNAEVTWRRETAEKLRKQAFSPRF